MVFSLPHHVRSSHSYRGPSSKTQFHRNEKPISSHPIGSPSTKTEMARTYDNSLLIPRMAPAELDCSPGKLSKLRNELNLLLPVFFPFLLLAILPSGDLSTCVSLLLFRFLICYLFTRVCMNREHSTLWG